MKHANRNLRTLVGAAMLSAVAFVLQFLEFPVPLSRCGFNRASIMSSG